MDFVEGLSPVISIEQKTIGSNPRSTVGTLTDIHDYLCMLFATLGQPHCPLCEEDVPVRSSAQMVERLLALPQGTEVEVRAPVLKIYGEDYPFLLEHIRTNGCRRVRIDGEEVDIGNEVTLDEDTQYRIEAIIERFRIQRGRDKEMITALEHGLKIGEGFFSFHVNLPAAQSGRFYRNFGCSRHRVVAATQHHGWFTFNDPAGACVTCAGLGVYLHPHPTLLVPDKTRSLREGALAKEVFQYDKNTWNGRLMYSLGQHYGFDLDTPFQDLPEAVVELLFHGIKGEKFEILMPPDATQGDRHIGKKVGFQGFITNLERQYRWYRSQGESRESETTSR